MSSPDGQREQQLIRGQIVGVVAKGPDRWQVSVQQQNEQRPRNLWTKDQAIVSSLMQQIGQGFDFLCNVSHWTNQQNQPVRSLWLETVGPYGTIPMPLQPSQMGAQSPPAWTPPPQQAAQFPAGYPLGGPPAAGPTATTPPGLPMPTPMAPPPAQMPAGVQMLPPEVRETRILRQTAMKCAVQMLPYLDENDRARPLEALQAMAEWFVAYFTGGPSSGSRNSHPAAPAAQPGDPAPPAWVNDPGPSEEDPNRFAEGEAYTGGFPG